MSGSSHIWSVLIGVQYQKLFTFCYSTWVDSIKTKLSKQRSKVQQYFDIHCQLEHFEYEMNQTLNEGPGFI